MAKVMKEAKAVVRFDGTWYKFGNSLNDLQKGDMFAFEKKMVIGLKPGRKRTVHLVMTWEDE